MQWTDLVADLQNYCQQDPTQPGTAAFQAQIPTFVNNAELRIYRKMDLLFTRGTNASATLTPGSRSLSLGGLAVNAEFVYPIVVQGISAITPAATTPADGTRVTFAQVSIDFIDAYWPQESATAAPAYGSCYFAMLDHQTAIVAPTPDQAYTVEVTGTWRPMPMSAANPETYLGDAFPDLLLAGSMVEATAWLRDWGQQSDDPRMALSWETHFSTLLDGAMAEEAAKKGQGPGWTPFSPTPEAKPRS